VVRVAAISLKMADIPTDEYSWRKYGQKPIKGSPHPRYLIISTKQPYIVILIDFSFESITYFKDQQFIIYAN